MKFKNNLSGLTDDYNTFKNKGYVNTPNGNGAIAFTQWDYSSGRIKAKVGDFLMFI